MVASRWMPADSKGALAEGWNADSRSVLAIEDDEAATSLPARQRSPIPRRRV